VGQPHGWAGETLHISIYVYVSFVGAASTYVVKTCLNGDTERIWITSNTNDDKGSRVYNLLSRQTSLALTASAIIVCPWPWDAASVR